MDLPQAAELGPPGTSHQLVRPPGPTVRDWPAMCVAASPVEHYVLSPDGRTLEWSSGPHALLAELSCDSRQGTSLLAQLLPGHCEAEVLRAVRVHGAWGGMVRYEALQQQHGAVSGVEGPLQYQMPGRPLLHPLEECEEHEGVGCGSSGVEGRAGMQTVGWCPHSSGQLCRLSQRAGGF